MATVRKLQRLSSDRECVFVCFLFFVCSFFVVVVVVFFGGVGNSARERGQNKTCQSR